MFFLFLVLGTSFSLCQMCLKYGRNALYLARSGAPREEIVRRATKRCGELSDFLKAVCNKYLETQLDALIEEAKASNKNEKEYCTEHKICSKKEIEGM